MEPERPAIAKGHLFSPYHRRKLKSFGTVGWREQAIAQVCAVCSPLHHGRKGGSKISAHATRKRLNFQSWYRRSYAVQNHMVLSSALNVANTRADGRTISASPLGLKNDPLRKREHLQ